MFIAVLAGERSDTAGLLANGIRDAKNRVKHPQGLILEGAENAVGVVFGPAGYGIDAAKNAFKEKGSSSRAVALLYLAKEPDPYILTLLEWALSDDSWGIRVAAAKALAKRGDTGTIPKLQFLLDDPHEQVRVMSAAALLRIAGQQPSAPPGN
jgi:hypothetical protein